MAEYIEREALQAALVRKRCGVANQRYTEGWNDCLLRVKSMVSKAPSADVAPVVHGRFVYDGPRFAGGVDWWHCSNCGRLASGVEKRFDYCPNCGARMDDNESEARYHE